MKETNAREWLREILFDFTVRINICPSLTLSAYPIRYHLITQLYWKYIYKYWDQDHTQPSTKLFMCERERERSPDLAQEAHEVKITAKAMSICHKIQSKWTLIQPEASISSQAICFDSGVRFFFGLLVFYFPFHFYCFSFHCVMFVWRRHAFSSWNSHIEWVNGRREQSRAEGKKEMLIARKYNLLSIIYGHSSTLMHDNTNSIVLSAHASARY